MQKVFRSSALSGLTPICSWLVTKLRPRTLLLLEGPLGSGKTALVKHLAAQLGYQSRKVKSPTFSLLNRYLLDKYSFFHLDLYRLNAHDQFLLEEMKELLSEKRPVIFVEWPEKMDLSSLQAEASRVILVRISFQGKTFRKFEICVK